MNSEEEKQRLAKIITNVNGTFYLAGFDLTDEMSIIQQAIIDGKIGAKQASDEIVAYVKEHKTMDGYIEAKGWK